MTKTDLVTRIAKDASLTKGQAEKALHAMIASTGRAGAQDPHLQRRETAASGRQLGGP
jgi:nucleoid DNA-binding protein